MSEAPTGLVYRDAALRRPVRELVGELVEELGQRSLVGSLLAASALETALADDADPVAEHVARATDAVAEAFVGRRSVEADVLAARARAWASERLVRTSVPEGFAYDALSPRAFAEAAVDAIPDRGPVLVAGIRTVGTALSALARAALRERGHAASSVTVRPCGHPYDRRLELPTPARATVLQALARGAFFLVVDEGRGNSGSSFLAVAEALVGAGVPSERVRLLGTRALDPARLVAFDAARRFARFRFHWVGEGKSAPFDFARGERWVDGALRRAQREREGAESGTEAWALDSARAERMLSLDPPTQGERCSAPFDSAEGEPWVDLSFGAWQPRLRPGLPPVPVWIAAERRKLLSADGAVLRKFAGLGVHGRRTHDRALRLAALGLTPEPLGPPDEDGFLAHHFIPGRPLTRADATPELVAHLGLTVALRAGLPLPPCDAASLQTALTEMTRLNDGRVLKTDAVDHGDDHVFPGPTDPAWDLAGALHEWQLDDALAERLVSTYRHVSRDDPTFRLPAFRIAYAAFRARLSVMAASTSAPENAALWHVEHER